jgi:hypothetical protein
MKFVLFGNYLRVHSKMEKNRNSPPVRRTPFGEFSSGSIVFIEFTDADPPQAGGMTNTVFLEWIHLWNWITLIILLLKLQR